MKRQHKLDNFKRDFLQVTIEIENWSGSISSIYCHQK